MIRALCVLLATSVSVDVAIASEAWIVRTDLWGSPSFSTLNVTCASGKATGVLDGDALDGSCSAGTWNVRSVGRDGKTSAYVFRQRQDELVGTADLPDSNNPHARAKHAVTAWRLPERRGGPRLFDYRPSDYSNTWNADRRPVLVVWPGDTIHTTTVDSGGVDQDGITSALFGNPQTGPFFIVSAEQGDTLVVHIRRLALNRGYADSLDTITGRVMPSSLASEGAALGRPVRWLLDRDAMRARPEKPTGALASYSVPLKPMLGGLAVAPGFGMPPISTGDTGRFGGNMDFSEVAAGNTVYLPVQQPGALLYLGDAHALQGDGETSQYALETSMDVTVTVDIIKSRSIPMPRVESPREIMVLGQAGTADEAIKVATAGMIRWLREDYGMSLSEAAQVLGTAMRYTIPNLAGRNVGVAARLDKALLPPPRFLNTRPPGDAKNP